MSENKELPINPNPEKTDELFAIPSKLRDENNRHDSIQQRISIIRNYATENHVEVPDEFKDDEHFWYTVSRLHGRTARKLDGTIPDKNLRRKLSFDIAVENANEIIIAEHKAATDGLTGAWSRTALENFITNIKKKGPTGGQTAILFSDLDFFKSFNDQFGHEVGDTVLKEYVALLNESDLTERTDMVARYGGEEFAVVLANSSTQQDVIDRASGIQKLVENNLRERVLEKVPDLQTRDLLRERPITASFGLKMLSGDDVNKSAKELLSEADQQLYRAKENGKNRVYDEHGDIAERATPHAPKTA